MIKINLLPVDRRKTERTPFPRLMLICITAAAAALVAVGGLYIFYEFVRVGDEIDTLTQERNALAEAVKQHDDLLSKKQGLERKVKEIQDITVREPERGYWYAVNALWDVIHAHPKVWIDNIQILDERSVLGRARSAGIGTLKPPVPYGVSFSCHVAGSEVSEMTTFRDALKNHPVLQETLYFINIDVAWDISVEGDFEDTDSLSFNIALFGPNVKPKVAKAKKKPGEEASEDSPKAAGDAPVKAPAKKAPAKGK